MVRIHAVEETALAHAQEDRRCEVIDAETASRLMAAHQQSPSIPMMSPAHDKLPEQANENHATAVCLAQMASPWIVRILSELGWYGWGALGLGVVIVKRDEIAKAINELTRTLATPIDHGLKLAPVLITPIVDRIARRLHIHPQPLPVPGGVTGSDEFERPRFLPLPYIMHYANANTGAARVVSDSSRAGKSAHSPRPEAAARPHPTAEWGPAPVTHLTREERASLIAKEVNRRRAAQRQELLPYEIDRRPMDSETAASLKELVERGDPDELRDLEALLGEPPALLGEIRRHFGIPDPSNTDAAIEEILDQLEESDGAEVGLIVEALRQTYGSMEEALGDLDRALVENGVETLRNAPQALGVSWAMRAEEDRKRANVEDDGQR